LIRVILCSSVVESPFYLLHTFNPITLHRTKNFLGKTIDRISPSPLLSALRQICVECQRNHFRVMRRTLSTHQIIIFYGVSGLFRDRNNPGVEKLAKATKLTALT
jgi:hypothetical protein